MFADENKQGRYSECTPVHKEQSYVRQYNCIGFLAQAAGGLRAHLLAALSGRPLAGCMHACMFTLNLINIPNISGGAADRIKNDRSTYRKAAPVSTKAPIANPLQHTRSIAQLLSCGHKLPQVVQYSPVPVRSTTLYTQRYAERLIH